MLFSCGSHLDSLGAPRRFSDEFQYTNGHIFVSFVIWEVKVFSDTFFYVVGFNVPKMVYETVLKS